MRHIWRRSENVWSVCAGNPEWRTPFRRAVRMWANNIKMDFKERGIEGVACVATWKGWVGGWMWPGRDRERQRNAMKTLAKLPYILAEMWYHTLWFRNINWWWNSVVGTWPSVLQELSIKWVWFCQYQVSVIVGKHFHSRTTSDLIVFCFIQVYHVTVVCWWEVLLSLYPTCLWCKLQGRSYAALCRLHTYTFFFRFLCV